MFKQIAHSKFKLGLREQHEEGDSEEKDVGVYVVARWFAASWIGLRACGSNARGMQSVFRHLQARG